MNPAVAHMIARQRHAGQRTRFGEPVVMHVERVAAAVTTDAQSVAYLHDVLEHTDMTLGELRVRGLEPFEAEALVLLTRGAEENFESHSLRLAYAHGPAAALARIVRMADLDDHLTHRLQPSSAPPYRWARRHTSAAQAFYDDVEGRALAS